MDEPTATIDEPLREDAAISGEGAASNGKAEAGGTLDLPASLTTQVRTRFRRGALTFAAALTGATGLLLWRDWPTAVIFLSCAAVTLIVLPGIGRLARRYGAVALPGGRDVHDLPTPLIGGTALFIPIGSTLLVLGLLGDAKAWGLLAGGSIVFASGLLDDLRGASARVKIVAQVLAAGVLLWAGFRLPALGIPGLGVYEFASPILSTGVLLFWIVLATNALNLSDGLDGLATSLAILGMGVLVAAGLGSLVPVALAGACLGFLYFNLPRARIFLGDAGSLLLGFLLGALALEIPIKENVPLAAAAFAYPLGDVTLCVFRRLVRGKPLFAADRSHIHHKAFQYLGSPLRALLALLAFAGLQATLLVLWPGVPMLVLCGALWFALGAVLARAGNYQPARVFAGRQPMRRLHALQSYVAASLAGATSRAEVELALLHLSEAAGLDSVTVADLRIEPRHSFVREAPTKYEASEVPVRLPANEPHLTARFCTWSAAPTMRGPAMDQERETIMAALLRQASDRLDSLDQAPPKDSPQDALECSTTLDLPRPAQERA